MKTSRAAASLCQPTRLRRRRQRDWRMGDVAVTTNCGEDLWIFDHRNGVSAVTEQPPALRQARKYIRPVLEPGATDQSARSVLCGEALQCIDDLALAEALRETAAERH